jgi:hypothetical protein
MVSPLAEAAIAAWMVRFGPAGTTQAALAPLQLSSPQAALT